MNFIKMKIFHGDKSHEDDGFHQHNDIVGFNNFVEILVLVNQRVS